MASNRRGNASASGQRGRNASNETRTIVSFKLNILLMIQMQKKYNWYIYILGSDMRFATKKTRDNE